MINLKSVPKGSTIIFRNTTKYRFEGYVEKRHHRSFKMPLVKVVLTPLYNTSITIDCLYYISGEAYYSHYNQADIVFFCPPIKTDGEINSPEESPITREYQPKKSRKSYDE